MVWNFFIVMGAMVIGWIADILATLTNVVIPSVVNDNLVLLLNYFNYLNPIFPVDTFFSAMLFIYSVIMGRLIFKGLIFIYSLIPLHGTGDPTNFVKSR